MKKISLLLGALLCGVLVACGGEVRRYQVPSTTIEKTSQGYLWTVRLYIYDPAARSIQGELIQGKEVLAVADGEIVVPRSFAVQPVTARFRFPVPQENIPGAKLRISDGGLVTVLPLS